MIRYIVPVFSLLGLFFFPWPVSAGLLVVSALFVPVSGLALGILADLLYFSSGAALFPWCSLYGVAVFLFALLVHRFVKTRIME